MAMGHRSCSDYGRRSLDIALENRVATTPERLFAKVVCSFSPLTIKTVNYSQLSNAVSQAAWLIQASLGHVAPSQQTLWYTGASDLRYLVFALAASRTGHRTVLISPRNTVEAHLRLIRATSCRHVFTSDTSDTNTIVAEVATKGQIEVHAFPDLESIFWAGNTTPYPFERNYDAIANTPFLIMHTSASTNHPKPITWTHKSIAVMDSFHDLPLVNGERVPSLEHHSQNHLFLGFPMFHAAGWNQMMYCIFFESVPVFGPPITPLSVSLFSNMLKLDVLRSAALPPSILEEAAQDSSLLRELSRLDYVLTGGAPLSDTAGTRISTVTRLMDLVGSTECNCYPELRASKKPIDWAYHHFHPNLGLEYRHHSEDLYEAVFVRTKSSEQFQAAFVTFPEASEYATQDLFSKHPNEQGLWRYRGRKDNVIVLSNGEKFQPDEAEATLTQQPDIHTALLVGQNRFQPALFLVPNDGQDINLDIPRVMCLVDLANTQLPAHAQLEPSLVKILHSDIQLPRSLKGRLQRNKAVSILEDDIDALYQQAEAKNLSTKLDFHDLKSLTLSIRANLQSLNKVFQHVSDDANLFCCGMDSLVAVRLARKIKSSLEHSVDNQVCSRIVYENPSIGQLSTALHALNQGAYSERTLDLKIEEVREAISQAVSFFPQSSVAFTKSGRSKKTIILTGSTGSLGCYVLHFLMQSSDIGTIYCLNRSTDSASRQTALNREKGLRYDFSSRGVEFHSVDLSKPSFGLEQINHKTYDKMLEAVDCIIHLAWPVNWKDSFSFFSSQLLGCSNLVKFSAASPKRPRIVFASSVGVANSSAGTTTTIREESIHELDAAEPTGYSQSKLAAEHVLHAASCSPLRIPITICRIGQIAGATSGGNWSNAREWFPSLINASSRMGVLPESLGPMDVIDWIPVDVLGESMAQLVLTCDTHETMLSGPVSRIWRLSRKDSKESATYVHLVNPYRTRWSNDLLMAAKRALGDSVSITPLTEWVKTLETATQNDRSLEESSAGQLLDFYKTLSMRSDPSPIFETSRSCQMCPTLQTLSAIRQDWLHSWFADWDLTSFSYVSRSARFTEEESEKGPKYGSVSTQTTNQKEEIEIHGSNARRAPRSARTIICTLAQRLLDKVEPPSSFIDRLRFEPACSSAVRIALDAGWLEQLSLTDSLSPRDIAKPGQSLELLVRTFRLLSSARLIVELSGQRYKANRRTLQLCNQGIQAGLNHWFDNMAPTFCQLPAYFAANGYAEPISQEAGPYAQTFGSQTYWQRLISDSKQHETFNRYMQAHKKLGCSLAAIFPLTRLAEGFDKSISDTLLIDIGGGKGHHLLDLVAKQPNLPGRLVLEDLSETLPSADSNDFKQLQAASIAMVPHNFFQPQPIAGARYYYFSAIFHDWPDSFCHTIIKQTAKAMVPRYSRLLINGIILPEGGASYFQAAKDWGMMAAMSGKERTLKHMEELVGCVPGLRVAKVWYGPWGKDSVLECELDY